MDCVRVQQGDVWRGFPSLVVAITLAPQRFVPGSSTVQDDEPRAPGLAWGTRQHKRTMLHLRNWKTHIAATLGNLATRKGTMSSRRELEQERLSEVHRQVQTAVCSEPFAFNWKLQTATLRRQSLACSVMHLRSTRAEKNHSPCWGSKDAEAHNSKSLFVPDEVKMAQPQRGCAETSFERLQGHRGFSLPNPNRETGIQARSWKKLKHGTIDWLAPRHALPGCGTASKIRRSSQKNALNKTTLPSCQPFGINVQWGHRFVTAEGHTQPLCWWAMPSDGVVVAVQRSSSSSCGSACQSRARQLQAM